MTKLGQSQKSKAPKKIPSPEAFLFYFEEYVAEIKEKPFLVHDFVGKDGDSVERRKEKCLTMEGFETFLENEFGIGQIQQYLENREGRYSQYVDVVKRVKRVIREDQITGGMAQIYNGNLTARLQGLSDTIETKGDNVKLLNIDLL